MLAPPPGVALARRMAARSDPAPESRRFATVMVRAATAEPAPVRLDGPAWAGARAGLAAWVAASVWAGAPARLAGWVRLAGWARCEARTWAFAAVLIAKAADAPDARQAVLAARIPIRDQNDAAPGNLAREGLMHAMTANIVGLLPPVTGSPRPSLCATPSCLGLYFARCPRFLTKTACLAPRQRWRCGSAYAVSRVM